MKTIDVLFAADMKRDYGCGNWFLRQHGMAMGGYGKPRRWHRDVVERYLAAIATAEERKREEQQQAKEEQATRLADAIEAVRQQSKEKHGSKVSSIAGGRILGKGGRGPSGNRNKSAA